MKTCLNCDISFNTYEKFCPLCQNKLTGSCKNYLFPHNKKYRNKQSIFHKILLFLCLVSSLIILFIDINISDKLTFSKVTILGIVTGYFVLNTIISNFYRPLKLFMKLGPIITIFILIWYFFTEVHILTNYIVPSICLLEILYNFVIYQVLKEKYFIHYSRMFIINLLFLLLPGFLSLIGLTTNNIMAHICFVLFATSLLSLFIFAHETIREEIKKMINIKLDV